MFKRKVYKTLLNWKNEEDGRTAALIQGARRVGKSTLVEEFAKNEYASYILIDFSLAPSTVLRLFDDLSDLNYLFLQLQLQYQVELYERKSVIIFDEVQLYPKARQAIKHLVKDHRYDYIETGSLLTLRKNVQSILIPSEEHKISMFPMDYEEFRWALGDTATIPLLRHTFQSRSSLGDAMNRKLLKDYRLYLLVGGMPQAVAEYLRTNNFMRVDNVKHEIISLYEDDFRKIDPTGRASLLFDAIPAQLSANGSRYHVSSVLRDARPDDLLKVIADMQDSMTVLLCYHANDPGAGLAGHKDLTRFKIYVLDTGIFTTLAFKDRDFTENEIYTRLLNDKLSTDLGYLYENAVAQALTAAGNELYYHCFPYGTSNNYYETDFLLSRGNKICPIEVKSSGYKTHASLDAFSAKFSRQIKKSYLIYTKDYRPTNEIDYVPFYMTQFL
ncbi:MAG: ATP-binding protein [Clostridia bacterium]|nr:ATP-binding protein [Clostridia bacterium]